MVNNTLFLSSILIMFPQCIWQLLTIFLHWHTLLAFSTAFSSILNHGFSNRDNWTVLFMWFDRTLIILATAINVFLAPNPNILLALFGGIMYFLEKNNVKIDTNQYVNLWHIILHLIGSSSNVFVTLKLLKS